MTVAPRSVVELLLPGGRSLSLGERTLVMGIVNVTPDSFAGGTAPLGPEQAVELALRLEDAGADLLDIGGESTRPGAQPVDLDEERRRVLPVVEALGRRLRVPMSVDTYKSELADEAMAAGAAMINDISGLQYDPRLGHVAAVRGAPLVLMHMRGRPDTMSGYAQYGDPLTEVSAELEAAVARATAAGVARQQIVLDPGIGFAKRPAHSYQVLARLGELAGLGLPLLVGASRKSFMREALSDRPAHQRDWGTAAAVTAAVLGGAHIVRVHAVAELVQVVRVADAIRAHRDPIE